MKEHAAGATLYNIMRMGHALHMSRAALVSVCMQHCVLDSLSIYPSNHFHNLAVANCACSGAVIALHM